MTPLTRPARQALAAILLVGLALAWLLNPSSAQAHAKLLRATPAAGSLLEAPPQEIQLHLSEAVSLDFSMVTLYNRSREEQPLGPLGRVGGDDTTVSVPINGSLPPGTYTVVWRVLSAVDGHLTAGNFAFRVRPPDAQPGGSDATPEPEDEIVPIEGVGAPPEEAAGSADPLRWLVRAIILASALFLLGGPIVSVLVVEPSVAEQERQSGGLWRAAAFRYARAGAVAATLLILALVLDLMMQIAAIKGTSVLGAFESGDAALLVLQTTRYGFTWALKALAAALLMAIMLFIWLGSRRGGSGVWEVAIAAASLMLLAQSLGSHAAAVTDAGEPLGLPLPVISDWLHLVMAGTWAGGLGYIALALFPAFRAAGMSREERRAFLGRAIPRFSLLAIGSVVALAVTGAYNLLIHATDPGAILGSTYGQVLAIKVGLFLALVVIGAVNLRRLSPQLRGAPRASESTNPQPSADARPVRTLRRNVRLEVALAVAVLICAGGLTLLPPPSDAADPSLAETLPTVQPTALAHPPTPTVEPTPRSITTGTDLAGYNLALTVRPSFEGDEFTLRIHRLAEDAPPLTDVRQVIFRVTPQDVDAGSTSYTASLDEEREGQSQVWRLTEHVFTLDGAYMITTIVQRTEAPDMRAAFRVELDGDELRGSVAELIEVRVDVEPSPPVSGTAVLTLTLLDAIGQPVEGAEVSVSPLMPAHAHIEPTGVAEPVPGQPGRYAMPVQFSMGGAWLLVFNVERGGQPPVKLDASLDVIGPEITPTPKPPG